VEGASGRDGVVCFLILKTIFYERDFLA